jgi:cytochrome bd ubiquinol oxidase subunit II
VSALAGALTLLLVWTGRYGLARASSALAVVAIVVGWAVAQNPYLLPPDLTLDEGAAADATLQATIIVVGVGLLILGPSLWYLYRLVLKGQLDQTYEPLDQRFHT